MAGNGDSNRRLPPICTAPSDHIYPRTMCQYSGAVVPPPDGHLRQYLSFMVALHPGLIFSEEPNREKGNEGRLKNGREQVGRCRCVTSFKNREGLIHAPSTILQRIRNELRTDQVKVGGLCLPPSSRVRSLSTQIGIYIGTNGIHPFGVQVQRCTINPKLTTNLHAQSQ